MVDWKIYIPLDENGVFLGDVTENVTKEEFDLIAKKERLRPEELAIKAIHHYIMYTRDLEAGTYLKELDAMNSDDVQMKKSIDDYI